MNKFLQNNEQVILCHKSNCIYANGMNAKVIIFAVSTMLILFGIATLLKSTK